MKENTDKLGQNSDLYKTEEMKDNINYEIENLLFEMIKKQEKNEDVTQEFNLFKNIKNIKEKLEQKQLETFISSFEQGEFIDFLNKQIDIFLIKNGYKPKGGYIDKEKINDKAKAWDVFVKTVSNINDSSYNKFIKQEGIDL